MWPLQGLCDCDNKTCWGGGTRQALASPGCLGSATRKHLQSHCQHKEIAQRAPARAGCSEPCPSVDLRALITYNFRGADCSERGRTKKTTGRPKLIVISQVLPECGSTGFWLAPPRIRNAHIKLNCNGARFLRDNSMQLPHVVGREIAATQATGLGG